jgi:hypothetical protein
MLLGEDHSFPKPHYVRLLGIYQALPNQLPASPTDISPPLGFYLFPPARSPDMTSASRCPQEGATSRMAAPAKPSSRRILDPRIITRTNHDEDPLAISSSPTGGNSRPRPAPRIDPYESTAHRHDGPPSLYCYAFDIRRIAGVNSSTRGIQESESVQTPVSRTRLGGEGEHPLRLASGAGGTVEMCQLLPQPH